MELTLDVLVYFRGFKRESAIRPHLIRRLGVTAGRGYHLGSLQHQKSGKCEFVEDLEVVLVIADDSQGLMPDPEKIQGILQIPEPEDVTALKRFLGMVTYLAKFMSHLSEMTKPLRRLKNKNVEF